MRTMTKLGAAFLLLLLAAISAPALADEIHFSASLDGSHELPPVTTDATGSATFTVNDAQTEIAFTLSVVGIDPANITVAHIHFGATGVAGPILFTLSAASFTSPLTGTLTSANLTADASVGVNSFADAITAMVAGNTYVNVHTTAHPDGEIRGQIGRVVEGVNVKIRKSINPRSRGVIAVTILSNASFNACTVDGSLATLGPAGAHAKRSHCVDVNEDGLSDLLMHFRTQDTGIQCGDTSITLSGQTSDGASFQTTQSIRTVGCNGHGHGR